MSQNKRTIIRSETCEVWRVRRKRRSNPTYWCEECRMQAEWLNLAETARLSGITLKEIFQLIETGIIHFQETPEGRSIICLNSIVSDLSLGLRKL